MTGLLQGIDGVKLWPVDLVQILRNDTRLEQNGVALAKNGNLTHGGYIKELTRLILQVNVRDVVRDTLGLKGGGGTLDVRTQVEGH
ncbi:MAG: hypothetical protein ACJAZO_003969 [Myxococcota bacterium]|jgi:hypothetical protein